VDGIKNTTLEESDDVRLIRLAATAKKLFLPSGAIEESYFAQEGTEYPGLDPAQAYSEFKELLTIVFAGKKTVSSQLDKYRAKGNVKLTLSGVQTLSPDKTKAETVEEKEASEDFVPIVFGTLNKTFDIWEKLAREVANILTIHTTQKVVKGQKEATVSTEVSRKDCESSLMYYIKARQIRSLFELVGDSNVSTRDQLFSHYQVQLKSPDRNATIMQLILLMDKFTLSTPYGVPVSDEVNSFYESHKSQFPAYVVDVDDKGNARRPHCFKFTKFKKVVIKELDRLWQSKILVSARLGGSKSSIITGHAWLDLPARTLETYQEALDIVNLCCVYGFETVELEDGGFTLAEILVASRLQVICPKLSRLREPAEHTPGVYNSSKRDRLYWMGSKEVPPHIKDKKINYPEEEEMDRENSFCYFFKAGYGY
jgi:hypothetical protein